MSQSDLVRMIIRTYELPPKLEGRIMMIAERRVEELRLSNFEEITFEEIYDYVARLVERFRAPFHERSFASLDAPLVAGSDLTLLDIVAQPRIAGTTYEEYSALTLKETIGLLEGRLEQPSLQLLRSMMLTLGPEYELDVGRDKLLRTIPRISRRLEALVERYVKSGRLAVPGRRIVRVQLEPEPLIVFGRRGLGDPLAFFRAHPQVYADMSRSELANLDGRLYYLLRRERQLHLAIPEIRKTEGGYRGFESPLAFFLARPEKYGSITRTGLQLTDSGLYSSLINWRQLAAAIPKNYRGFESPLAYFQAHPELLGLSRTELKGVDPGLERALRDWGQLDNAIPRTYAVDGPDNYRGHKSPMDYYKAHEELHALSRAQLMRIDVGLYHALHRWGQMDKAAPKNYRGHPSPLDYYNAHPEIHGLTKSQLQNTDKGLYLSLKRRGQLDEAIPKI